MEEEIIDLLIEFSHKHDLGGEDNYFLDVEERIDSSDEVKQELTELVKNLYKCFIP